MSYDFFSLQPLLIARLESTVTPTLPVISGMNQDEMLALYQTAPAIYVLYSGYTLLDQLERETRIDQSWIVTLVVPSTRTTDVKTSAGPIVGSILESLIGWQPSELHGVLFLAPAPEMTFQAAATEPQPATFTTKPGLWHIPLGFQSTIYVTGNVP